MNIIKLISIILLVVLILYYLGTPIFNNVINLKNYIRRAKQYSKEKKDQYSESRTTHTDNGSSEGFWHNWFNADCKLCELDKQQMKKAASVSKNLNRPQEIFVSRVGSRNSDLDQAVADLLAENSDMESFDSRPMVDAFNRYVGYGNITLDSDMEEKRKVVQNLNEDKNRYQNPKKLLEDEFLMKLRKLARDLAASNENVVNKKKLLNQYREDVFQNLKKLKDCKQILIDIKSNYDQEDLKLQALKKDLDDLIRQLKDIEDLIRQRGSPQDRDLSDKINALDSQISQVQSKLSGLPSIERKIQEKLSLKANLGQKNMDNANKIRDYESQLEKAKLDKDNAEYQLRLLGQNLELKQQYTQIVEQNLKIAYDNFEIVKYTKELFNKNASIDELKKIHSQNIENQKVFLKKIKDYEQRVKNIGEGYEIVKESSIERLNYEQDFQDNEKTYQEIESKYMELKKIIDDYEHRRLQYELHQVKKKEHEDQIADIQRKMRDFQKIFDDAERNLKMYQDYINQLNNDIRNNTQTISQIDIYLQDNNPNRNELESQLEYLRRDKQSLLDTLGARRQQFEEQTRSQRQQKDDLQKRIYDLRNQIKDSEYNLNGLRNDLRNQVQKCSGLKVDQNNLRNYLDYLERDQSNDVKNIEIAKEELHRMLNTANDF